VRALGCGSFGEYYRRVAHDDHGGERMRMIDAVCTNETHFFREPRHFELLESHIFPDWQRSAVLRGRARRIRIWSAACSTGEEPFSLAMLLARYFAGAAGWDCSVLATDLSTRALAAARQATWSIDKAHEIPTPLLKRFMLRGTEEQTGKMRAKRCLRELVQLEPLNLVAEPYPVAGPFDAIFCRNVLIYFQTAQKARVLRMLLRHLSPGGYLFLGHAETVTGLSNELQTVAPNVYMKR
jgi:chemotaxis protein methyltransferase CheR